MTCHFFCCYFISDHTIRRKTLSLTSSRCDAHVGVKVQAAIFSMSIFFISSGFQSWTATYYLKLTCSFLLYAATRSELVYLWGFTSLDYLCFSFPRGGCLARLASVSKHCKQTTIGSLEIYSEVSLRGFLPGGSFMLHMSKSIKTTSVWWASEFLRSSAELRSFFGAGRGQFSCRGSRDTRRHVVLLRVGIGEETVGAEQLAAERPDAVPLDHPPPQTLGSHRQSVAPRTEER